VLVIDDTPETRMSMEIATRGCQLLMAASGAAAMQMIATHIQQVDVVILDLSNIDGVMLCATVRQHDPVVPIIPLTGDPHMLRNVEHMGVSAPIMKPAEAPAIRRAIEAALGMPLPLAATAPPAYPWTAQHPVTHSNGHNGRIPLGDASEYEDRLALLPVRSATWDDIDLPLVEQHIQRAILRRGYDRADDSLSYLRHHECVVGGGVRPTPTLVGLIAFGIRPERFLTTEIDIAMFSTSHEEPGAIVKRRTVRGTAFAQIEESLSFLDTLNPQRTRMDGPERIDEHSFSPNVLREVVNNAVLHRDWSMRGAGIQIKLFPDRLEVLSPGGLPPGITIDTIGLTPGVRRNPALAELLRNAGYVERFGIGYKLIYRVLEEWGLGTPILIDHGQFFSVSIPAQHLTPAPVSRGSAQPIPATLNGRLREIIRVVEELGGIASSADVANRFKQLMAQRKAGLLGSEPEHIEELQRIYSIDKRQLQREMAKLVKQGLLFGTGETNTRRYHRQQPT